MFRTTSRDIDVVEAYHALGDVNSAALLDFHSFTGCDQTGKFNGYSKLSCWKTLTKFKLTVLEVFKNIGEGTPDKTPTNIMSGLVEFALDLYCPKCSKDITDLSSMRWHLFSKYQLESEKLPPTTAALKFMILRSHYIASIWNAFSKLNAGKISGRYSSFVISSFTKLNPHEIFGNGPFVISLKFSVKLKSVQVCHILLAKP